MTQYSGFRTAVQRFSRAHSLVVSNLQLTGLSPAATYVQRRDPCSNRLTNV